LDDPNFKTIPDIFYIRINQIFYLKKFLYTFQTFFVLKKQFLQKFHTHSRQFLYFKNYLYIYCTYSGHLNSKLNHFLGQKIDIFLTYPYIPGQILDIFDDNFRTILFYRDGIWSYGIGMGLWDWEWVGMGF
jgi:hypothetical protein